MPHHDSGVEFERIIADVFRRAGWSVKRQPKLEGGIRADLVVSKDPHSYVVEIKVGSEGRRDRLVPLASQAILEAEAHERASERSLAPLAIVCAPRILKSAAEHIIRFAVRYAPDVAVGAVDLHGFRSFLGPGLEPLNNKGEQRPSGVLRPHEPQSGLFSGINQWLLKVLLAPVIPEALLNARRGQYRNVSQLAVAAEVSVMSAFRFFRHMKEEGFLDDSSGALRVVRIEDLMSRWQAASIQQNRELRMRWLIRNSAEDQLQLAVRRYYSQPNRVFAKRSSHVHANKPIQICLGLFSAAKALGFEFVHGAPSHLYVDEPNPELFQKLGLIPANVNEPVDVHVRIPSAKQGIFRAAVSCQDVPVCDILQVWLDVSMHPARGGAQADEIRSRALGPLFKS